MPGPVTAAAWMAALQAAVWNMSGTWTGAPATLISTE
jgi:hypothetical protein